MLQSIDQWAFHFLFALYGLLGIQDIPREPSPDWTVIERWAEQPDKTYRLVLESTTIPAVCVSSPDKYIAFPQTYMGKQEILVDDHLVYTNSMSEKWNLSSVFDRPLISCRALSGNKIVFKVDAYIQFFMGIKSYPAIKNYRPIYNFFYNSIYLVAASVCVCLSIIASVLMRKLGGSDSLLVVFSRDILLAFLMVSYVPGYFLDWNIKYSHYLMAITLTGGFLFLIKPIFFEKPNNNNFPILFSLNAILWTVIFGLQNAVQLAAIVCCFGFVAVLFWVNILIWRDKEGKHKFSILEKFTYFLIFFLGAQDLYIADISREGYYHLSLLIIVVSISNFFRVIREVQLRNVENATVKEKLRNESHVIGTLSSLHELYKEVIHDLKAPVTALNFLAKSANDGGKLVAVATRFDEVLSKLEKGDLENSSADWYLAHQFKNIVSPLMLEKNLDASVFEIKIGDFPGSIEVFIDPVEFRIMLSELIDNSMKHSLSADLRIGITIDISEENKDYVSLMFVDNGAGVKADMIQNLGKKGFSTSGGGLGLYSIAKRVEALGGMVKFVSQAGFCCVLYFRSRNTL